MNLQRFRLLFFGSDKFSVTVLKYLLDQDLCPIKVVTGIHSELDRFSCTNGLERFRWPLMGKDTHSMTSNIGLVASFRHLIDVDTINLFKYGLFNIHPSLLPQYRGSSPIQASIMDDLKETGCTLIRIPPVAKFDIGDIVLQERLLIRDREFAEELEERLALLGANLSEKLLLDYNQCIKDIKPQDGLTKSYARKLKPEQGLIRFTIEDSCLIDRKIRAYTGTIELFAFCNGGLKIRLDGLNNPAQTQSHDIDGLIYNRLRKKGVILDCSGDIKSGSIFFHKAKRNLCIKCADGRWIAFDYVTPPNKPKMSAVDFYNGYLSKVDLLQRKTDV